MKFDSFDKKSDNNKNGHNKGKTATSIKIKGVDYLVNNEQTQKSPDTNLNPSPQITQIPLNTNFQEQDVILQQPAIFSRAIAWTIVSVTTCGVAWASVANLDQTIQSTGKLEPQGAVKEIKAPAGGVIREIFVKDGQLVKKDQILVTFDPTAPKADLESLNKVRAALEKENYFYEGITSGGVIPTGKSELLSLTKLRANLISENQYYQSVVSGVSPETEYSGEFSANQQRLLAASRAEIQSGVSAAQFKIQELEKQRSQTQGQLKNAENILGINQKILSRILPLVTEGAIPQLQYERQQQEVLNRQAEVERLGGEIQRLAITISQAKQNLENIIALSAKDIHSKIAENHKKISQIDTGLSQAKLENKKKISELDGQISKAQQALGYRILKSPVNGIVFDLKPDAKGFVVGDTQTLLKIVPNENLIASVYLTNRDIGFVREGMKVDIRIDSFPSTEFGSVKGEIISVGSDALAPTQERPFYSFPAKIRLDRQFFVANGKNLPLQSGMAVSCSILVRKRSVISILTDLFDKEIKGLESIR
jgi:hemolysin D